MVFVVYREKQRTQGRTAPSRPSGRADFFEKKNDLWLVYYKYLLYLCTRFTIRADVLSAVFAVLIDWAMLPMVLMPARCTSMATMLPRLPMRTTARSSIDPSLKAKPGLLAEHIER